MLERIQLALTERKMWIFQRFTEILGPRHRCSRSTQISRECLSNCGGSWTNWLEPSSLISRTYQESRISRFFPNLSFILSPLNALLCKGKVWKWTLECGTAFKEAKQQLLSQSALTHYDPQLPIRLARETSLYGVFSVISHILPDGQETHSFRVKDFE